LDSERLLSAERFQSIFDVLPVGVHESDCFGVILRVNETECSLLGYPPSEIVGCPVWKFLIPEQRATGRRAALRKASGNQPLVPYERQFMHRDGRRLTFQVHDAQLRNDDGVRVGIRSILLDVTERNEFSGRLAGLSRSGAELERFARALSACTASFARRRADGLDVETLGYFNLAIDQARRMQALVRELLADASPTRPHSGR
jgi:PAS domain S-box-containing protein